MDSDPTRASWQPWLPTSSARPGSTGSASPGSSAERQQVATLAREFEAYFILQLVRQMRQSMLEEEEEGQGLGSDTMTDTIDVELGRQLAANGGIGLTSVLQDALDRQIGAGKAGAADARSAVVQAGLVPALPMEVAPVTAPRDSALGGEPGAVMPLPVSAPVSSAFGWRADPFDGTPRFHSGIDFRAAYGREVPAAGAGIVVSAGTERGYGNTIVVEHDGGIRTRYAHLSSLLVSAGEAVDGGTVIGRVGSTGRSTGPHLHFEVLQNGQPVDPEVAATRYAGLLKIGEGVAD